ncbi:MAG TPA: hypothetical protein VF164_04050 [Trueperaceae bacterium]
MNRNGSASVAYPFAVVKTEAGFSAAALDFPAMASADSEEELTELLSEQAALYLYEAELLGGDPPMPTTRRELDRRRTAEQTGGTEFVYVEPADTNYISLAIERAMREEGVSALELAQRLGAGVGVVQRLTDPFYFGHSTRTLRAVAAALGRKLRVSFDV